MSDKDRALFVAAFLEGRVRRAKCTCCLYEVTVPGYPYGATCRSVGEAIELLVESHATDKQ